MSEICDRSYIDCLSCVLVHHLHNIPSVLALYDNNLTDCYLLTGASEVSIIVGNVGDNI